MKNISKILTFLFFVFGSSTLFSQVMPLTFYDTLKSAASKGENNVQYVNKNNSDQYFRLTLRNAPPFTLQISGLYDYGIYELSADDNGDFNPEEFAKGENFGVRHGLGGNITAKIPLHEKGNIRFNISASFNNFSSTYEKINSNPRNVAQFAKYNVFSGGVGVENNFTPTYKFKTLVGASLLASVISGSANIELDPNSDPTTLKIIPAFRLGINVYSGFEYELNQTVGFNFGIQFTHANLWLKSNKASNSANEIYLNDSKLNTCIPFSGWKQFAYGSFFGGVNIYFGVNEKQYVYRKF